MKKSWVVGLVLFTMLVAGNASALVIQGHDYEMLSSSVNPVSLTVPVYTAGTNLGYYVWSSDNGRSTWHIRWSGDANVKTGADYRFSGTVALTDNAFNVSSFSFESGDSFDINGENNNAGWWAKANTGHDGLDIQIIGNNAPSYIGFDLNVFALNAKSTDVSNSKSFIFIGADKVNPTSGDFAMAAPVPEPGTLLLLGSGLVGLAWYGRKRKQN